MTGIAAIALCGMFSGCNNYDDLNGGNNSAEFNIIQNYEDAFVTRFGQPAVNQTWGFGEGVAGTRSGNIGAGYEAYPATHTYKDANGNVIAGANMNHNEWADPNEEYGGWVVPDPLTEGQKLRVQKYFQANPKLSYEDPHYANFFIQQVYTGGTSAPETGNKESTLDAEGTGHKGMTLNQLTVGQACSHINDFNAGTCSPSNVLDSGKTVNNATYHSDQITLMVNVDDTSCFGYHETSGSNVNVVINHNDKMALVSAAVIDTWAASNGNPGDAVVDKWNRSFMGFDYELLSLEDSYAKDGNNQIYVPISDIPGDDPQYVWDGTKVMKRGTNSVRTRSNGTGIEVGDIVPMNETVICAIPENFNPTDGQTIDITNNDGTVILGTVTFHGTGAKASADGKYSGEGMNYCVERNSITFKANYSLNQVYLKIDGPWGPFYCTDNDGYFSLYGAVYNGFDKNGEMNLSGNVQAGHTYKVWFSNGDLKFWGIKIYHSGDLTVTSETLAGGSDNQGDNNQGNQGDNNQGNQGDNNQGNQGDNNQGNQGDNNQGNQGDNSEGNQGDNNQGNQGDNTGESTQNQEENYDYYGEDTYIIIDGKKIPYLMSNMNMYGGVQRTLSDDDMKIPKDGKVCLNLPAFKALVDEGYLPVKDKDLRTWVKWQGSDGYYSDWIVTLTEAKRQTPPVTPPTTPGDTICRIIVEDLTVGENSDFDFNDVVFDVCKNGDLIIRAIGGELPLYIGSKDDSHEVHQACIGTLPGDTNKGKNSHLYMRNTGWDSNASGKVTNNINYHAVLGKISLGGTYNTRADAKSIQIWVKKSSGFVELFADKGKVASKVCVGLDYEWCSERQDIDKKFRKKDGTKLFHEYVIGTPGYGDNWDDGTNTAWYQQRGQ